MLSREPEFVKAVGAGPPTPELGRSEGALAEVVGALVSDHAVRQDTIANQGDKPSLRVHRVRQHGTRIAKGVRDLGERARVEVDPTELAGALARSEEIETAVRRAGFTRVEVDPEGYRSGRLNDALKKTEPSS